MMTISSWEDEMDAAYKEVQTRKYKYPEVWKALRNIGIESEDIEIHTFAVGAPLPPNPTLKCVRLVHLPSGLSSESRHARSLRDNFIFAACRLVQGIMKIRKLEIGV